VKTDLRKGYAILILLFRNKIVFSLEIFFFRLMGAWGMDILGELAYPGDLPGKAKSAKL
jgi:hypothetical protein